MLLLSSRYNTLLLRKFMHKLVSKISYFCQKGTCYDPAVTKDKHLGFISGLLQFFFFSRVSLKPF